MIQKSCGKRKSDVKKDIFMKYLDMLGCIVKYHDISLKRSKRRLLNFTAAKWRSKLAIFFLQTQF
ncbi:hypothetical protein BA81_14681 [Bacillus safensis FO-36b]|nr:hypothetical protein RS87_01445 [Bacillus safensis FO-36b]KDE26419.1 hypothetical protein BA81_14681 [Bacillus safensis FO-36b]